MLKPAEVVLIVATAAKGVIGKGNQMPWHLPEDLAHFRKLTTGHCIIMGRKTFESIGKALPNRRSIVISRSAPPPSALSTPGPGPESIEWVSSFEAALALSQQDQVPKAGATKWPASPVFVIGGAQVYAQAMSLADRIEQTEIDLDVEGDAWFPAIDPARWQRAPAPGEPDANTGDTLISKGGMRYRFLRWLRSRND